MSSAKPFAERRI